MPQPDPPTLIAELDDTRRAEIERVIDTFEHFTPYERAVAILALIGWFDIDPRVFCGQ